MSNKPTHTAYVVIDPREGSDRNAQWIEAGGGGEHVVTDPHGIPHAYADRLEADS